MGTSDEEKEQIIDDAVEVMYIDIIYRGYLTIDELIDKIAERLREK